MRPVRTAHPHLAPDADPPSANVPAPPMLLSKGRWSVKQSSVLLYHRRVGELSHSWSGQVLEQQLGLPATPPLSSPLFRLRYVYGVSYVCIFCVAHAHALHTHTRCTRTRLREHASLHAGN